MPKTYTSSSSQVYTSQKITPNVLIYHVARNGVISDISTKQKIYLTPSVCKLPFFHFISWLSQNKHKDIILDLKPVNIFYMLEKIHKRLELDFIWTEWRYNASKYILHICAVYLLIHRVRGILIKHTKHNSIWNNLYSNWLLSFITVSFH